MNLREVNVGDCCFFLVRGVNTPKFGEIYRINIEEKIIHVIEVNDNEEIITATPEI